MKNMRSGPEKALSVELLAIALSHVCVCVEKHPVNWDRFPQWDLKLPIWLVDSYACIYKHEQQPTE